MLFRSYAIVTSGKIDRLDLTPLEETAGNALLFANHWTVSQGQTMTGAMGRVGNFAGVEHTGRNIQRQMLRYVGSAIAMKMVFSQIVNKAVTGHWTWENEPDKRDRVAVGVETTGRGEKRFLYVDANRWLKDVWEWMRPSAITGGIAGAILRHGLPKGGLWQVARALSIPAGAIAGAYSSKPVSELAAKALGIPNTRNYITPQMNFVWRKMTPAIRGPFQVAENVSAFTRDQISK